MRKYFFEIIYGNPFQVSSEHEKEEEEVSNVKTFHGFMLLAFPQRDREKCSFRGLELWRKDHLRNERQRVNNGSSLWNYRIRFQFSQAFLFFPFFTWGAGVLLRFIQENKFNPLRCIYAQEGFYVVYGSDPELKHKTNNASSDDDAQSTTKTKFSSLFECG